ncbi:MAG TPA: FKBP-type peptidyl-prolyl cis-trans isomerase [Desulfuromonadaceae bacterium]
MIRVMTILTGLLVMVAVCGAEDRTPLTDRKARDSYSLGYEFGANLKAQEVNLDEGVLIAAIREALAGKEPAMSMDDMRETLKELRKEVLIRHNLRRNERAAKNKKEGEAFLAANKAREGVVTLTSGLQYKVLAEGNAVPPRASDRVRVHYRGTLLNGTEFDSSHAGGGPATVRVNEMIPAWSEALQLMKPGAKWQLFVPAGLAYGERQYGKIPPNSTLVYELELVAIEKDEASPAE